MLTRLRQSYAALLTSGGQLVLLVIGAHLHTPTAWRVSLSLIALLSLLAWASVLRRMRAFTDTPTSQVASAAQGYVELRGHGKRLDGLPLLAPLTNLPCLWYRFHVQRRSGDKWVTDSSGESDASFLLDDGSGICLVDTEGAEIVPVRCDQWQEGNFKYSQWLILEQELVYVIGGFRTQNAGELDYTVAEEVKQLLAEWKQDMPKLLKRFDLDNDGTLNLREWELARAQARREAERRRKEVAHINNDLHWIGVPDGGRLYLISTLNEDKLVWRYRRWAWFHLIVFFAALVGLAKVGVISFSG
jgi:hypothetical protein